MLFPTPEIDEVERRVLGEVEELRRQLRHQLYEPRRWHGSLRRLSLARAIQGSSSIEGLDAGLDDVAAVALGEQPLDVTEETRRALQGYRDAMTYVLQLASEDDFAYSSRLFKSLHFMVMSYSLESRPGLWRQGAVFVRWDARGEIVYEGAEFALVPGLMEELAESLNRGDDFPSPVRAGMAHLNLVLVHPFKDGNGRMARCLESLVLARAGAPLSPVFLSIEEYLGRSTQTYYDVLAEVGGREWQPQRDARRWIRFVLTAHLHQARTMVRRIRESGRLWGELEQLAERHGLVDRGLVAMFDAVVGLRVRNSTYRAALQAAGDEITEATATRDLREMVEAGILEARGEKRGRYYVAAETLTRIRADVVADRDPDMFGDPFAD
jgi:Fic family protein